MRDYDIESDLKQEKFQHLKLVQGDKGNKIKINVFEDGQPVSLAGCSITAKYKRSDGQVINGSVINISNNSFDAVIDSDITKVSGTLKMLFSIEKDDIKVSTFLLLADVREGIGENTGSSGGSTGGGEVTVDLSNYYKKSETYSKSQIDSQFKDIANELGKNEDGSDIELPTTDKTIKGAITELFQNASNGKQLIATAITGKGVNTLATDTFQTMATNISKISGIDGAIVQIGNKIYKLSVDSNGTIIATENGEVLEDLLENRLLIWNDEFDGESLDTTKWRYAINNASGAELQAYTNRDENIKIENSNLVFTALKDNYNSSYAWSSGRIDTQGLQAFKYGRIEAKIKYTAKNGAFPAFWTLGNSSHYVGDSVGVFKSKGEQWAKCGEIDIFEGSGASTSVTPVIHYDNGLGTVNTNIGNKTGLNMSEYHIYSIEWDENNLSSYIDNVLINTISISDIPSMKRPHYLLLNLAVGSSGGTPSENDTEFKMYIDWVRVYAPISVSEKVDVESITLSQNSLNFNVGDDPVDVYYSVNPSTAWNNTVNYETNNSTVAEVYGSRIYPIGIGTCKITAKTPNNITSTINITVSKNTNINSTSITLNKNTLEMYKDAISILTATASPSNHTDTILWKTSNANIATVDNGTITGIASGNCTITAYSSADESVKAECSVTIKEVIQLTGHITDGLALQLDRNGMNPTRWTNKVDNAELIWKGTYSKNETTAAHLLNNGEVYYWNGVNYLDFCYLDLSQYYQADNNQTIIIAYDDTDGTSPIASNMQTSGNTTNSCTFSTNGVNYYNSSKTRIGLISYKTSIAGNNILAISKTDLSIKTYMLHESNSIQTSNGTISENYDDNNQIFTLGASYGATKNIKFKAVLIYNKVLTDEEVEASMIAVKTFLNS